MYSRETQQQQQKNRNAAALPSPTTPGALSLLFPRQPIMLEGWSPNPVATQDQRWMQRWIEQQARGRPRTDGGGANVNLPAKRGRGHALGSVNVQRRNPLEEEGRSFKNHVINVTAGEDIVTRLVAFMNQKPGEVCILSASGNVSSPVLRPNSLSGTVKYEGLYKIVNMAGTLESTESNDGTVTITRNLSVALVGPDRMMVEGCVGRMLVAGSSVKVFVGSLSGGGPGFLQSQGPQFSSEPSEEYGSDSLEYLLHVLG